MSILRDLHPAPSVAITTEGLAGYELLCTEAGRTSEGLTGSVALQNGHLTGDPLKVCWPSPPSCCAARAALAAQLTKATGREVKDSDLDEPLRSLYVAVRDKLHERRSSPGPSAPGSRPTTDMGNAERLVDQHGAHIRYCGPWRDWLAYDGARWRRGRTAAVMSMAKDVVRSIYQEAAQEKRDEQRGLLRFWAYRSEGRRYLENMVVLAQSDVPVWPQELDADGWLLNCTNGTVDLRTGELRPHEPEDLLTKSTGVAYDREARCPRFKRFLLEIMNGNRHMVRFLQRALGYSLSGDVREQCLFLPHGSGSNGKSKLLGAVQEALGDYALQAVSDLLLAKRFDPHPTERADLFGKRFVATIEVDEGRRLAESLTKQLTGGDRIRARRMRQDFWEFAPTHKIWLACNHRPVVRGTDDAIWRRIHLIPFGVRFVLPGQEQAVGGAVVATKPADPALEHRLREELPGILAWLVRGCLAWQAQGLRPPDAVTDATQKYRDEMNLLGPWIDDCCIVDKRLWASAKHLFASFSQWCETNGEKPMGRRAFGEALAERGFVPTRDRVAGKQARVWKGISLQEPPPDPPPAGQGTGEDDPGNAASDPPMDGVTHVTHGDASFGEAPQQPPIKEESGKSRHNASHASHPTRPAQSQGPTAPCDGARGDMPAPDADQSVTHVTHGDAYVDSRPIGDEFSRAVPKHASQCVTGVSRDPTTTHPTHPCPKGHHEWEFARSKGDPAIYGYVCRHPACLPGDRYGCWLPAEASTAEEVSQ